MSEQRVIDPALMSVLANRLDFVLREMTNTLIRTARSTTVAVGRDFSCTIITANDELLAGAEGLPIHVFGSHIQAGEVRRLHPDLSEGDAFLDNNPYGGNTHMADHTILVPVFIEGVHMFTASAKAHLSDIGNSIPTSYHPSARDIYEEGALCFPAVQVQRENADIDDIIRMCRTRIRVPDQWYGDYLAMLGAARIGERRLKEMGEKYGRPLLESFVRDWFDYSEKLTSVAIKELDSGTHFGHGFHDPTGFTDGPIPLQATVTINSESGHVEVDLRDNIDCQPFGMNLTEATSAGSAVTAVLNVLGGELPVNSGTLRRVSVLLRENCVAGIPRHPASCSVATSNLACRLINIVQKTMSEVSGEFGVAQGGVAVGAGLAVVSGHDRRTGRDFVAQPYFGDNGGPASSLADGNLTYGAPVGGGVAYRDSIEIVEQRYPLLYQTLRLLPDSGGAGFRRGGLAWCIEYGPRFDPVTVSFPLDGYERPAEGVRGGGDGSIAVAQKIDVEGNVQNLPHVVRETLEPGERIRGLMNGGGGFGAPLERHPQWVLDDAVAGYVTIDQAVQAYGVTIVIDAMGELSVDVDATERLRRLEGPC
mgnify:FL=1|jgi:N-methylhydantoinase B